jgi:hypothetical protein
MIIEMNDLITVAIRRLGHGFSSRGTILVDVLRREDKSFLWSRMSMDKSWARLLHPDNRDIAAWVSCGPVRPHSEEGIA